MGCVEDVKILLHRGCEIMGKWTPFHQSIKGNDHAYDLPMKGLSLQENCKWTGSNLNWARSEAPRILSQSWATGNKESKGQENLFALTALIPRHTAAAIARLRQELTPLDANSFQVPPPCLCKSLARGAKYFILHFPI